MNTVENKNVDAKNLQGGCLCGNVEFSVKENFKAFFQCHCKQCQQLTGSAFAANIFTDVDNIKWLRGREYVQNFEHPEREFSYAFCQKCGSALPFTTKGNKSLIIPAGSLLDEPSITPKANIFAVEKVCWFDEGLAATEFDGFPKRS